MRPRKAGATRRRLSLEPLESRLALATLFVATTGNDAADGSAAAPWRTLQHAADQVNAGDTVIVRPGEYAGFYLDRDGTAANRIVFQGEDGVTINQPNPVTADGINLEGADYVTIDGFRVVGMPRTGIRSVINHHVIIRDNDLDQNGKWGILTGFSDDILIENNVASRSAVEHGIYVSNSGDRPIVRNNVMWGNNANGLHMNGDVYSGGDGIISGALVENNVIYDNGRAGGSGINCDGVQNSTFRNNLIYNTHASGISLYRIDGGAGSSGNLVVNNTVIVAADGRWALNIQDGSTGNTIRNNILFTGHSFRGSIDISADSLPGFSSDYNVVMDRITTDGAETRQSLAQWQASSGQDLHSLVATPNQLFVNPAAFDFHLSTTSPAVNAGTSQFAPTADFEGTARPSGGAFDIGADELGTATPPPPPPPPPPPTNQAPSDIALSGGAVKENSAAGVVAGSVSAVDPDSGDTHTFALVDNAGGRFAMSGNQIVVAAGANLNYEAATSHTVVVRATDSGGLSYDESLVINVTNANELVSFDVQRGAAQRSYIRYLDMVFESAEGLSQLVSEGRFKLTRSTVAGNSPVNVSLAGKLTVVGNRVTVNFGSNGIGGNRNSTIGNGHYRLTVDADRNGTQETQRSFYRLLGDTNGDRTVNTADVNNILAFMGRRGSNLDQDVNGDGVVNSTDRTLARGQLGKTVAAHLPIDD
jgi:parallel beta-helix repeat protein